jgi:integrase
MRSLSETKDDLFLKDVKKKLSRRVVELPQFVQDALADARLEQQGNRGRFGPKYQDQDLICPRPNRSFITPNTLSSVFCRFKKGLMLKTRFHDLRHGHASQALQDGTPVKTVQRRLGHATAAFTLDVYGHLMPGDDRRAVDAHKKEWRQRWNAPAKNERSTEKRMLKTQHTFGGISFKWIFK